MKGSGVSNGINILIKLWVLIFLVLISEVHSKRPSINLLNYYLIENDLSQTHRSPLCSQTSHYAGWLLWLTVENWMTIKAKAGKRDTCCSLQPSEMTGQWGECMVNSYLLCLCTLNWAFGASIINMQLQSLGECAGEVLGVYVFVWCVSRECVWLITHLCPLSELWPFSPFVRRVREETRGPSRHEITDYTLNASPRGLSGAQKSKIEGEWGGGKKERERETEGRKKQTNKENERELQRGQEKAAQAEEKV